MKLYATVSSERARKGQGGNDSINIVVRNEKQQCIGHINFYPDNTCRITILDEIDVDYDKAHQILTNDDYKDIKIGFQKGKKQKGDCNYVSEDSNVCITHNIEH